MKKAARIIISMETLVSLLIYLYDAPLYTFIAIMSLFSVSIMCFLGHLRYERIA